MNDETGAGYYIQKTYKEVDQYLERIKDAVAQGNYKISEREDKNLPFIRQFNVNRSRAAKMILSLCPEDFLHAVPSKMEGNEGQELFVFCRRHALYRLMSSRSEEVLVYYKFDLVGDSFAVVVSMHEAERDPEYAF
ncbi:hypothetical protein [Thermophilibacter provencensis]|uniref:Uncharacterized protein n=1 Tax=Thermophilibacter provencensis TaxID=1852386 RepID=A0ABT7V2F8_9ACTN|nr:hypothetical protein [Thermophilibacter provencensis]MDM8270159.1 hypothetical protein [Thermophilibacter provencensis]